MSSESGVVYVVESQDSCAENFDSLKDLLQADRGCFAGG